MQWTNSAWEMKINEIRSSERANPAIFLQATSHFIFLLTKSFTFRIRFLEDSGAVKEGGKSTNLLS